ncbi:holo-ACP synthase [Streptomyces sp. NPDC001851]|uniref:holo-ACP synthase n=1 Tax=Streptomyces sp. NPDC001851 TaxID=3154529 RepID=UPI0033232288
MRIGVDVLALGELDRLNTREWFRRHTYADEELGYAATLSPSREREFLAGRFAAKEAVVKALGTGFGGGIRPAQVCVARDDRSAPVVRLSGAAARHAQELGLAAITVSIAHKGACVVAVALAEDRGGSAAATGHQAEQIATTAVRNITRLRTGMGNARNGNA